MKNYKGYAKNMNIRFVDLSKQNKILKSKIMQLLDEIVNNAYFVMSEEIEIFERAFAKYCNKKYAVGVNSGTDALRIALLAYGIGIDSEVITVPNSYFATAMVISSVRAKPVFVDIDPITHTIDVAKIEKKITRKTRAIIPVHLFGQPADMDPIYALAKKYSLVIIEDACQAHGAMYKGKKVPYGETGVFSFYPGKNLGTFGDGGVLVTNNKKVAEKARCLRNDGSIKKYHHTMIGMKSRLDTINAAILSMKLPYIDGWNKKRREHAKQYTKLLKNISDIVLPTEEKNRYHIYHLYVIETKKRDKLQKFLKQNGIETIIHYPIPIHLQKAYHKDGFKIGDYPITEEKAKQILSLPMYPELESQEITYVCNKIKEFFEK